MMASDFIIDVTEADFELKVLAYSQEIPVVVDFWAEWCAPCRVLGPILEKFTNEASGSFRLAKVNVDENPNLSKRYQIHSIPAVKAFRESRIISEFTGLRSEPQIKDFLNNIAPSPSDLSIEKGYSMLDMHRPVEAEHSFRQALEGLPSHPRALLGLCKSLLWQGRAKESSLILATFPASREYGAAETLRPLAEALVQLDQYIVDLDNPLDAAYTNAIRLVSRGNFEAAMDGLLDILRQDKRFRGGQAHKLILAILELFGEKDPIGQEYRSELALALF